MDTLEPTILPETRGRPRQFDTYFQFMLTRRMDEAMRECAERQQTDVSSVVRKALHDYLVAQPV